MIRGPTGSSIPPRIQGMRVLTKPIGPTLSKRKGAIRKTVPGEKRKEEHKDGRSQADANSDDYYEEEDEDDASSYEKSSYYYEYTDTYQTATEAEETTPVESATIEEHVGHTIEPPSSDKVM